jgi:hypothetical protein
VGKYKVAGRIQRPVDRTNPAIPHFDIQEWLKDGERLVSRRELYDFVSRLERGRARAHRIDRRIGWAIRILWGRMWSWLKATPVENEDHPEPKVEP